MQIKKRHGFTIIELVIVIAVIAILAAVLIPVFSNVINKAQRTYDTGLVRQLNNSLVLDSIETGVEFYPTAYDAVEACDRSGGFNVPRIVSKSDCNIAWDSVGQHFVLIDTVEKKCIYPESTDSSISTGIEGIESRFFVVSESKAAAPVGYSIYAGESWKDKSVVVDGIGFDAGKNDNIENVTYTDSGSAKDVIIRTDGYDTKLIINAENDTVKHYGKVNKVDVNAISMNSYHEFGDVAGNINLVKGNVVVEEGCKASAVVIDMTEDKLTSVTNISADNTKAAYVPIILNTTKEAWGSNANKNLIDPSKNRIIYTKPGASSTVIGNEGQTVTDVTDVTAYNQTKDVYYMSLDKAIEAADDNETIMLLKDEQIFKGYSKDDCPEIESAGITLNLNGYTLTWPFSVWLQGAENLSISNGSLKGVTENQSYSCFFGDEMDTSVTLSNLNCTGGFNFYNTAATLIACNVTLNAGYNTIWADENSDVTVISGKYDASGRTVGQGVIGCDKDAFLTIKGGTFISNDDNILLTTTETSETGEYESDSKGIFIQGGTFNVNVSDFTFKKLLRKNPEEYEVKENYNILRNGYKIEKRNNLWTVSAK